MTTTQLHLPTELSKLCTQAVLSSQIVAYLQNISTDEWDSLIDFTNYNHLSPLLLNRLTSSDLLDQIPSTIRLKLESKCWDVERRVTTAFKEICLISEALNDHRIQHCFLKGSAILLGGYDIPNGSRFMRDIDLLVHPKDLDHAYEALMSIGYHSELTLPRPITDYWSSKHLPPLTQSAKLYRVECHQLPFERTFLHRVPLTTDEILENRQLVNHSGLQIPIPSPEHMIISVFYHSQIFDLDQIAGRTSHRSINDVAGITSATGTKLDWDEIEDKCTAIGAARSLSFFLNMTRPAQACTRQKTKKSRQTFRSFLFHTTSKAPAFGRLLANTITFCREIARSTSTAGKNQRKVIYEANPDNWKYSPLLRQFTDPTILSHRLKYLFQRK